MINERLMQPIGYVCYWTANNEIQCNFIVIWSFSPSLSVLTFICLPRIPSYFRSLYTSLPAPYLISFNQNPDRYGLVEVTYLFERDYTGLLYLISGHLLPKILTSGPPIFYFISIYFVV